jgi:2-oxoglutarate ferredoxin oxidoreductase subunit gamma
MMTHEIIFAGFGGQGILSMGKFLAFGGMVENLNVSWCPSYGPEMRGGTANCSVILSDEEIGAPLVTAPDTLVVMNRPSLDKFESTVKSGGTIILDSNLVNREVTRTDVTVIRIPAQDEAEAIGFKTIANMILLGALVDKTGVIPMASLLQALKEHGKEKFFDMNKLAIDKGIEYAQKSVNSEVMA